ncbi:hypothetical protein BZZ01_04435 [Nostocales cyanobacterium HT-58-2]|nr:hypothetical protein BZZ01_04435 [Nostocales cyanobacterium HT-58-2]
MRQIDISQATAQPESLFQAALEEDEIIIMQNNQPIFKIVRINQPKKRRQSGSAKCSELQT